MTPPFSPDLSEAAILEFCHVKNGHQRTAQFHNSVPLQTAERSGDRLSRYTNAVSNLHVRHRNMKTVTAVCPCSRSAPFDQQPSQSGLRRMRQTYRSKPGCIGVRLPTQFPSRESVRRRMAQQEIHKILPTYRGNHRRIDDLRCRVLNCTGENRCEPEQFARSRVSEDKAPSGL